MFSQSYEDFNQNVIVKIRSTKCDLLPEFAEQHFQRSTWYKINRFQKKLRLPSPWANTRQLRRVTQDLSPPNTTKLALFSSETELLAQSRHFLFTRRPGHWTKQDNYVPMNIRCFKYSCCWNSTWEKCLYPLHLFLQRPISSTVWYIGQFSRMGTALRVSDIRIELQGRISSGWGGDFVQEAVSKSLLPGILSKAQRGKENQDVGLSQGSNYFWKWIWVAWDEESVLEQVTWSL